MVAKRFAAGELPTLGSWVRVCNNAKSSRKAVDRNAQEAPALVTSISENDGEGVCSVVYPNELVLRGFVKGNPIKTLERVDLKSLRKISDGEVPGLEKLLLKSLMMLQADTISIEFNGAVAAPSDEEAVKCKSPSPANVADSDLKPRVSVNLKPKTKPQAEVIRHQPEAIRKSRRESRLQQPDQASSRCRSRTPPNVVGNPRTPPRKTLQANRSDAPTPEELTKLGPDRLRLFTIATSKVFQGQAQSPARVTKKELSTHLEGQFSAGEIDDGMKQLNDRNKIMVFQEVVFRI